MAASSAEHDMDLKIDHYGEDGAAGGLWDSPATASGGTEMESFKLPEDTCKLRIVALNISFRALLAKSLDPMSEDVSDEGNLKDFRGLAELIGFNSDEIRDFEHKDKTKSLLAAWEKKSKDATIGQLWKHLIEMERIDILENPVIQKRMEKDVTAFKKRQRELMQDADHVDRPVVDMPKGPRSQDPKFDYYNKMEMAADEFRELTIDDVGNKGKTPVMYDAFVSYCHKDIDFVKEMIRMLEQVHNLKLCVNARDLVIGTAYHVATAHLIAERCRKVLIVMSQNFLKEPECDFQVRFAQALSPGSRSRKMIPITIEPCQTPLILRHVTMVDHSKCDLQEWFWVRLAKSIESSAFHDTELFQFDEEDKQGDLSQLQFEFEKDNKETIMMEEIEEDSKSLSEQSTQQIDGRAAGGAESVRSTLSNSSSTQSTKSSEGSTSNTSQMVSRPVKNMTPPKKTSIFDRFTKKR